MNDKVTYTDFDLMKMTSTFYGASFHNMSIDWLYNPIKAVSEKAVLFIIDGYNESVTVRQLLNMADYGLE